jgi:hypothetical protein
MNDNIYPTFFINIYGFSHREAFNSKKNIDLLNLKFYRKKSKECTRKIKRLIVMY